MIFARVLSALAFAFSFSLLSASKPVTEAAVEKRAGTADIAAVFNTLKANVDAILPQIDNLVNSGQADSSNIVPLINQLTSSISSADAYLTGLRSKRAVDAGTGKPGPSKDELAKLIAAILIAIIKTIHGLLLKAGHLIPTLSLLIIILDLAVYKLLLSVDFLVAGVLSLVAGFLLKLLGKW